MVQQKQKSIGVLSRAALKIIAKFGRSTCIRGPRSRFFSKGSWICKLIKKTSGQVFYSEIFKTFSEQLPERTTPVDFLCMKSSTSLQIRNEDVLPLKPVQLISVTKISGTPILLQFSSKSLLLYFPAYNSYNAKNFLARQNHQVVVAQWKFLPNSHEAPVLKFLFSKVAFLNLQPIIKRFPEKIFLVNLF